MAAPFEVGDLVTADALNGATYRPCLRLHQTVSQTGIVSGVENVVSFTTEDIDPAGWHDNVTNNSRVTPNLPGLYEVSVVGVWVATTNQITASYDGIRKNGVVYSRSGNIKHDVGGGSSVNTGTPGYSDIVECNGTTDYVEMTVGFNGTANQATNVSASGQCVMTVKYLGPNA